jgi:hypothetical protein
MNTQSLKSVWQHVIMDYSERLLSQQQDRLPALAGLARKFQTSSLGEYYAGIWELSLRRALLWSVGYSGGQTISSHSLKSTSREFVAPTRSYFSIQQACIPTAEPLFSEDTLESICHVDHVICPLASTNPFGRIVDAHLTLKAKCVSMEIAYQERLMRHTSSKVHAAGTDFVCSADWTLDDPELEDYLPAGTRVVIAFLHQRRMGTCTICQDSLYVLRFESKGLMKESVLFIKPIARANSTSALSPNGQSRLCDCVDEYVGHNTHADALQCCHSPRQHFAQILYQ